MKLASGLRVTLLLGGIFLDPRFIAVTSAPVPTLEPSVAQTSAVEGLTAVTDETSPVPETLAPQEPVPTMVSTPSPEATATTGPVPTLAPTVPAVEATSQPVTVSPTPTPIEEPTLLPTLATPAPSVEGTPPSTQAPVSPLTLPPTSSATVIATPVVTPAPSWTDTALPLWTSAPSSPWKETTAPYSLLSTSAPDEAGEITSPPTPAGQATLLGELLAPASALEREGVDDLLEQELLSTLEVSDPGFVRVLIYPSSSRQNSVGSQGGLRRLANPHQSLQETGVADVTVTYYDSEGETGQEQADRGLTVLKSDDMLQRIAGVLDVDVSEVTWNNLEVSSSVEGETSDEDRGRESSWLIVIAIIVVTTLIIVGCVGVTVAKCCMQTGKDSPAAAGDTTAKATTTLGEGEGNVTESERKAGSRRSGNEPSGGQVKNASPAPLVSATGNPIDETTDLPTKGQNLYEMHPSESKKDEGPALITDTTTVPATAFRGGNEPGSTVIEHDYGEGYSMYSEGYTEGGDGVYSEFGPDRYSEYEPSMMGDNMDGQYSQDGSSRFNFEEGSEWGTEAGTDNGSVTAGYRRGWSSRYTGGPLSHSQASLAIGSSGGPSGRLVPGPGVQAGLNVPADNRDLMGDSDAGSFVGDLAQANMASRASFDSAAGSLLAMPPIHTTSAPPPKAAGVIVGPSEGPVGGSGVMDDDAASAYDGKSAPGSKYLASSGALEGTTRTGMAVSLARACPPRVMPSEEEVQTPQSPASSQADGISQVGSFVFTDMSSRTDRVLDRVGRRSGGLSSPTSTVLRSAAGMSEVASDKGSQMGSPYSGQYSGSDSPSGASGWERAWMRQRSENRQFGDTGSNV